MLREGETRGGKRKRVMEKERNKNEVRKQEIKFLGKDANGR